MDIPKDTATLKIHVYNNNNKLSDRDSLLSRSRNQKADRILRNRILYSPI